MIAKAKSEAIARAQRLDEATYGGRGPRGAMTDAEEELVSTAYDSLEAAGEGKGSGTHAGWKRVSEVVSNLICRFKT